MRVRWWRWPAALACVLLAAGTLSAAAAGGPPRAWLDRTLPATVRATALVAAMTRGEKLGQLHGIWRGAHHRYVPGIRRLAVPPLRITNGPAGVAAGDDPVQPAATALPAPIALAATFDPAAAHRYGRVLGTETRASGHGLVEAPDVNIARVPTGGRVFESYGEDPYLAGRLAAADIRGIQSTGTIAEVKHFAANNQETDRDTVDERIDDRTLHEIYLTQFEAAVRGGRPGAVMCAYPRINGTYACQHRYLLHEVLRGQWGFDGFVQSDFDAAHDPLAAVAAGMDLELPSGRCYGAPLRRALAAGTVRWSEVDAMLVRRFATEMRIGVFDRPPVRTELPTRADAGTARRLAAEGMVLLRNERHALPLSPRLRSVAVVGPAAGAAVTGGGGSSRVRAARRSDPVAAIRRRLGAAATVRYAPGDTAARIPAAVAAARRADVAVVMVGDGQTEGSDRRSLALPGVQDRLVRAVAAANPATVVVVKSGGAVLLPWHDEVPAILDAWYPGGQDGAAVAAVLFGDAEPGGRLPLTFPAADSQVPAHEPGQYPGVGGTVRYSERLLVGYRWYDARRVAPRYPFGFGLSYTTFALSRPTVARHEAGATVRVEVGNTGARPGTEVVQVYLGFPAGAGEPPRQLAGVARVRLTPGEHRTVAVRLPPRAFRVWDTAAQRWRPAPGRFRVYLGDSSAHLSLAGSVTVPR
ncbi:beta-glucosidase [Actinocatenispora comari]|uniref:beta-glucosidase n=1 Tax=Actinocatenispora comari TaxID=2807577 RepID=UPI001A90D3AB|nr:glycoside hydrolase family 3 C-terminal domain-containing protein [Actinocatenispora comari]